MDALALRLEHSGDWILGEPVDLQVGVQAAQLPGDRDITLGVTEPDRRGDEQRARTAVGAVDGRVAWRPRPSEGVLGEVPQRQVEPDGLAGVQEVAGALDRLELATAEAGQRPGVLWRCDLVTVAGDHEHRTVQVLCQPAQGASTADETHRCDSEAVSVSGSVSSAHPTPSSMALVECGSGRLRETNHSADLR